MIYSVTMYSCKCDHCGKQFVFDDYMIALEDETTMEFAVNDSDWEHTEDDKHYCPDCFEGFDDDDIILKKLP